MGAIFLLSARGSSKQEVNSSECKNLTSQQLSSERSLGLVVENRRLFAVKLVGYNEKNYSPPGGHVESGETYQQALVREIKEEVGLTVQPADLQEFKIVCEPRYGSIERTYYYLVNKWSGTVSLSYQGDQIKWVNYKFANNKSADTELKTALLYLKEANLID